MKFIYLALLLVLSSVSLASGLTLTASQSVKMNLDTAGSVYRLTISLPSDLEADSQIVTSVFDGAIQLIQNSLDDEHPGNTLEAYSSIEKGQAWIFPVKQAVQPNPVVSASEFNQLVKIQFSELSDYASDRMTFVRNIEEILYRYFDETKVVEIWETDINYPISLIPQLNPFEFSPPHAYHQFSDLNPDQKQIYKATYERIFKSIKEELEEKCRIVKSNPDACGINHSDIKISDKLLKTTPRKHYFLELFVEAKW